MSRNSQGTDGFRHGSLKRHVNTVRLVQFDDTSVANVTGDARFTLLLKNLNDSLNFQVSVAIYNDDNTPFKPDDGTASETGDYPLAPGVVQLVPVTNYPDAPKTWLRPVFQNPANVLNENDPLPQDIPFGWNDAAETDEVEVVVVIPRSSYAGTGIKGALVAQAMVEYNGQWWDVDAISNMLSQVQFSLVSDNKETIGTQEVIG